MVCARHRAAPGCARGTAMEPAEWMWNVPCCAAWARWELPCLALCQPDLWFGVGVSGEDPAAFSLVLSTTGV